MYDSKSLVERQLELCAAQTYSGYVCAEGLPSDRPFWCNLPEEEQRLWREAARICLRMSKHLPELMAVVETLPIEAAHGEAQGG